MVGHYLIKAGAILIAKALHFPTSFLQLLFFKQTRFFKLLSIIWNKVVRSLFRSLFQRSILIDNNNNMFGTKEQKNYLYIENIFSKKSFVPANH